MIRFCALLFAILNLGIFANAQTLDLGFTSPIPLKEANIYRIFEQPNGKYLIGGDIDFVDSTPAKKLVRINEDGSLDETFHFTPPSDFFPSAVLQHPNGDIFVSWADKLARLSSTGEILNIVTNGYGIIAIVPDGDENIVVAGSGVNRFSIDLTPDENFNSFFTFDNIVWDVKIFNNQIYASGEFHEVNSVEKNNVVRLNFDGTIDMDFDTGTGSPDRIVYLTMQDDGKILLGGDSYITSFNGTSAQGTIRLNNDGSVDDTFAGFPSQNSGGISKIKVYNDKIYVAEFFFYSPLSGTQDFLIRLNMDGSRDEAFEPIPLSLFGTFLAGFDINENGILISRTIKTGKTVAKYSLDGVLDQNFDSKIYMNSQITTVDSNEDFVMVGGSFTRINQNDIPKIAKLAIDGSLIEDFLFDDHYDGANLVEAKQVKILAENSVLVSTTAADLIKINASGSIKGDFNYNGNGARKFIVRPDSSILLVDQNGLHGLTKNGLTDEQFNTGPVVCCPNSGYFKYDFDLQSDGKIVYGSAFTSYNEVPVPMLVRLNPTGSLDESFNIGDGPDGNVTLVKTLSNDEILVAGNFLHFDGLTIAANGLVKLSSNGIVDQQFNESISFPGKVPTQIIEWADRLLIASLVQADGKSTPVITSVFKDGTTDDSFAIPTTITISELSKMLLVDNNLYLAGKFLISGETLPRFLLKLNLPQPPIITGSEITSVQEDTSLSLAVSDLIFESQIDQQATLQILDGENYSIEESTLIPDHNFNGLLHVGIIVNNLGIKSKAFYFDINVDAVNDAPSITIENEFSINEDDTLELSVSDFHVVDPDNSPEEISIHPIKGANYEISDATIIPKTNYYGALSVQLFAKDASMPSDTLTFEIAVIPVNDVPVITEMVDQIIYEDTKVLLSINDFLINDPDNDLKDLSISIKNGDHFTIKNDTLIPNENYNGKITIAAQVSDGTATSNPKEFEITVNPVNDPPIIKGITKTYEINDVSPLEIKLTDIDVEDVDNTFPDDFTFEVMQGKNYSVINNSILPTQLFTGKFSASLVVNDGHDDSDPFSFSVDVNTIVTSTESEQSSLFMYYPQPVGDFLFIELSNKFSIPEHFSIHDISGRLVSQSECAAYFNGIAVTTLAPGLYIGTIKTQREVITFKFTKQ
jgi:uncharacterized delta-60 repeat protein